MEIEFVTNVLRCGKVLRFVVHLDPEVIEIGLDVGGSSDDVAIPLHDDLRSDAETNDPHGPDERGVGNVPGGLADEFREGELRRGAEDDRGGEREDGKRSGDDDVPVHGFLLPFGSLGVNPKDGELF